MEKQKKESYKHNIKYGELEKQVFFLESDHQHAKLIVRLHYDGIYQGDFFRGLINEYVENNELMIELVDVIKKKLEISRTKRKYTKRQHELAKDTEKKFALKKEEIEDIFDVLEEEFPDL